MWPGHADTHLPIFDETMVLVWEYDSHIEESLLLSITAQGPGYKSHSLRGVVSAMNKSDPGLWSFIKRLKIYFLFYFYTLPLRLEYWAILRKRQFRECKMIFNYCFATVLIDSRQDNIEVYMSKL